MNKTYWAIALSLAVILGVPFAVNLARPADERVDPSARRLVVITPHVQQIHEEFGPAFNRWHQRVYGETAYIDFRHPGGTSEIFNQLRSEVIRALETGRYTETESGELRFDAGAVTADVMFGGGTYDHGRLTRPVLAMNGGAEVSTTISMPPDPLFSPDQLDEWYGENLLGNAPVYDPDQHWFGNASSGFGIVFNRDILRELGLPDPTSFEDLGDPRLNGWVALTDPNQSGSITTSLQSILDNYGWERGWRTLRTMSGNTRYFTDKSTKPPIDVAMGEAAMGLAIDFYGRSQSQAVLKPGQLPGESRVGYIDPPGKTFIDPDPASILNGASDPELARRFIEFLLSEEAQALWQFPALDSERGANNPNVPGTAQQMGPQRHELRRMPIRRVMHERYASHFIDQVNPYAVASSVEPRGWRSSIQPMMGAFAIDTFNQMKAAWRALNTIRARDPIATRQWKRALREFDTIALGEWQRSGEGSFPDGDLRGTTWVLAQQPPEVWPGELVLAWERLRSAADRHPDLVYAEKLFFGFPSGEAVRQAWDARFSGFEQTLTHDDPTEQQKMREQFAGLFNDFNPKTYGAVRNSWRLEGVPERVGIVYSDIFRDQYRLVVELADDGR